MSKNKKLAIALILILIPIAAVGYTFFFGHDDLHVDTKTLTVDGRFVKDTLESKMDLVPGDTICEDIDVAVTSTADSLLRVKVTANDGTENGVWSSDILEVNLPEGSNWIKVGDFYYYNGVLNASNETDNTLTLDFIENIKFSGGNDIEDVNSYQNKNINVLFDLDLIQYNHKAYRQAWSIAEGQSDYAFLEALYPAQPTE